MESDSGSLDYPQPGCGGLSDDGATVRRPALDSVDELRHAGGSGKQKRAHLAMDPFSTTYGAAGRNRTHDPLVRSQVLYPAELQPRKTKL